MDTKHLVENYRKGILEYNNRNYSKTLEFFKECLNLKNIPEKLLSNIFSIEKEILINSIKNSDYSLLDNIYINDNYINSLEEFIYSIAFYSLKNNFDKSEYLYKRAISLYNNEYLDKLANYVNKKNSISACIICKNNQDIIEDCLKSLLWTDEIIVLDTGSTDNTKDIANKYSKVYEYKWEDDFSKSRNKALEYCTKDWILFLDSDQEFPKELIDKARLIIQDTTKIAFHTKIKIDDSLVNYLRLFRNNFELKYKGIVHEQIYHSLKFNLEKYKYFQVSDSIIYIKDNSYKNNKVIQEKQNRNINLLKKAIDLEKDIYDKAYYLNKLFESTSDVKYLELAFEIIKNFSNDELIKYNFCVEIYKYYIINKDINLIDKALEIFNYSSELHLIKSKILLSQKKYFESKYFFDKSMELLNNRKNYFSLINKEEFINFGNFLDKILLKIKPI